jgi:RNA polymerase sigma-70 factor (ECF subfamily)
MDAQERTRIEASKLSAAGERHAAGVRTSDRSAIEALYRAHAGPLRRFIRAKIRSETDAEDVLQEVFLRICRRGETASLQSPAAVLFTTGFRLALNVLRRRRNSPIDERAELERLEIGGPEHSPETSLIGREQMAAADRALEALPPQCRKVLMLRALEELSYDEMSRRLGLSISTLEKHVVKGRRLLREGRAALG